MFLGRGKGVRWRLKTESNRRTRLCRPLHNHSAIQPFLKVLSKLWSGKRGSNSRPQPWQGCALPLSYSRVVKLRYDLAKKLQKQRVDYSDAVCFVKELPRMLSSFVAEILFRHSVIHRLVIFFWLIS